VLGFTSTGTITSWLPLFLFVILFGLSMDYHVFILSRIREAYDRGMKTEDAVAHGIKQTAGTVTSAAIVMVFVFGIFATLTAVEFKQMGVGLAVAVLIDATIVRAVLLPATMKLLGDWNWFLPSRLQWLPRVEVEAEAEPARLDSARRLRRCGREHPAGDIGPDERQHGARPNFGEDNAARDGKTDTDGDPARPLALAPHRPRDADRAHEQQQVARHADRREPRRAVTQDEPCSDADSDEQRACHGALQRPARIAVTAPQRDQTDGDAEERNRERDVVQIVDGAGELVVERAVGCVDDRQGQECECSAGSGNGTGERVLHGGDDPGRGATCHQRAG
jgi:hypothetical protein